jgi:hypothetical protein
MNYKMFKNEKELSLNLCTIKHNMVSDKLTAMTSIMHVGLLHFLQNSSLGQWHSFANIRKALEAFLETIYRYLCQ